MNEKYDVIETASQSGNFRVFLQALEATGLTQTLKEKGPYTVLAPIDDAFVKIPRGKLESLFKTENRESLQSILKNHIVAGKLPISELKSLHETKTMKGDKLRIDCRSGFWINEAQIIFTDLQAANGVLHAIDAVIMPQPEVVAAS